MNELDHSGFSTQTTTIFAGNIGGDRYIVQVSDTSLRLLEGGECQMQKKKKKTTSSCYFLLSVFCTCTCTKCMSTFIHENFVCTNSWSCDLVKLLDIC